jgi:hypothetical protein
MKNKIEEYINAIIQYQEANYLLELARLTMGIVVLNLVLNMLFAKFSTYSIVITASCFAVFGLIWRNLIKKIKTRVHKAEQNIKNLHPLDGENGAFQTLKKSITETIQTTFGKKFISFKRNSYSEKE